MIESKKGNGDQYKQLELKYPNEVDELRVPIIGTEFINGGVLKINKEIDGVLTTLTIGHNIHDEVDFIKSETEAGEMKAYYKENEIKVFQKVKALLNQFGIKTLEWEDDQKKAATLEREMKKIDEM